MTRDPLAIFDDPGLYDLIAPPPGRDASFYVAQARRFGGPVLELACGTGRIARALAAAGFEVVGLDQSQRMVDAARERAPEVAWVRGDMRDFRIDRRFGLVCVPFNAIPHLHEREDIEALLRRAHEHLDPNGALAFDVFHPTPAVLARDPTARRLLGTWRDERGATLTIEERSVYDAAAQRMRTRWYGTSAGDRETFVYDLDYRVLFPRELEALLHYNRFAVVERFGGFDGEPFTADSPLQVIVARPM